MKQVWCRNLPPLPQCTQACEKAGSISAQSRAMSLLKASLAIVVFITVAAQRGRAQAVDELTAEQRATIDDGGQVFLTWDVSNSAWPRACAYQHIDAMPEEAAAVFTNYERHVAFIPKLRKSTISRVIDPVTAEVDYILSVPIVADEHYTVRAHLSTDNSGASYRTEWTLVRATSTKATEGSVRFEPHRSVRSQRDGTLMAYCNLVTPGSRLAKLGFIKSKGLALIRQTAGAIVSEVERQRAGSRALLDAELRTLRSALLTSR
jgi:hypothetical protein